MPYHFDTIWSYNKMLRSLSIVQSCVALLLARFVSLNDLLYRVTITCLGQCPLSNPVSLYCWPGLSVLMICYIELQYHVKASVHCPLSNLVLLLLYCWPSLSVLIIGYIELQYHVKASVHCPILCRFIVGQVFQS